MTDNIVITNRALAQIGSRSQIVSMVDGSQEALYANLLYNPLRDFMLREGDYDFSIKVVSLVVSGTPAGPWAASYACPTDAIRIRSLIPIAPDDLNPIPIAYNVVSSGGLRFIYSNDLASAVVYTFAPIEDVWDSIFTEAYTRLLGSALAFAIENRIEASKQKLTEALQFAGIANLRDA